MPKARLYHRPCIYHPESVVIELFTDGRDAIQVVVPWWAYIAIREAPLVPRAHGEYARPVDDVVVEVRNA